MHSSVPSGGASGGTGRKDVTSGEELGPEDDPDLGDLPGSWAWPDHSETSCCRPQVRTAGSHQLVRS